jgi:diacylglycerol O-acyltransferase / wax synthase
VERLSGMDASFLYTETPTGHMHVTGVIVIDAADMVGGYQFERLVDLIQQRLHRLQPFRRRLVEVPLSFDHPVWIEDPDFDITNHMHRVTWPKPGGKQELAHLVGDLMSRPLDRQRPLWEMWVAEGGKNGRVALISKIHHSAIDGVTGADLMSQLFDLEPGAPAVEPPEEPWQPEPIPTDTELLVDAIAARVRDPLRAARAARRTLGSLTSLIGTVTNRGDERTPAMPFTGPHNRFTGSLSPDRAVAFGKADLEALKVVKNVYGCKLNDVVLATCSVALRSYLLSHGEDLDKPLLIMCPVSTHGSGGTGTNQVSSMAVRLPVHMEDPVDQLLEIFEDTKVAKEVQNALGADMLSDITQFAPPVLFNQAMRLYSRSGLADRHAPVQNGVISNVPGPPIPMWVAGAPVVAVYPLGPLIEGAGLNITVISNMGRLDIGIVADRALAPDIDALADHWEDAVKVLCERANAEAASAG